MGSRKTSVLQKQHLMLFVWTNNRTPTETGCMLKDNMMTITPPHDIQNFDQTAMSMHNSLCQHLSSLLRRMPKLTIRQLHRHTAFIDDVYVIFQLTLALCEISSNIDNAASPIGFRVALCSSVLLPSLVALLAC